MAEATSMYVNDYDLGNIGFQVVDLDGWRDFVQRNDPVQVVPGRTGVRIMSNQRITASRRITVDGLMVAASNSALRSALAELVGRLSLPRTASDRLNVRFNDDPTRLFFCRLESANNHLTAPKLSTAQTRTRVRFVLDCPEPEVFENSLTNTSFDETATEMPLGSAPVRPTITLPAPLTAPTVIYRNAAGTLITQMIFTDVTLVGSQSLVIDCDRKTITLIDGSNETNFIDELQAGSDFITLDPADGDIYAGSPTYPTLEITPAPTGTDPSASYRKAWFG